MAPGSATTLTGREGHSLASRSNFSVAIIFSVASTLGSGTITLGCGATAPMTPNVAMEPAARRATGGAQVLLTGDLVFLDLACEQCRAIAAVTRKQFGVSGPNLSHVGIVERRDGAVFVLESWPRRTTASVASLGRSAATAEQAGGVQRTPLAVFLARVEGGAEMPGGYYALRFRGARARLAARAAERVRHLLGKPYDATFLLGNGAYYCSELLFEAFAAASENKRVFEPRPMRFGAPGSPEHAVWRAYYKKLGQPMPTGRPGVSPLGLYLRAQQLGARPPARQNTGQRHSLGSAGVLP